MLGHVEDDLEGMAVELVGGDVGFEEGLVAADAVAVGLGDGGVGLGG